MSNSSGQERVGSNLPLLIISILLIVIICVAAGYFYFQYQSTQYLLQNPSHGVQKEVKALISVVGRSYQLPSNETPTLVVVSNNAALPGDEVYASAKPGDKVLVYAKNKLAILYRPSVKKIISTGSIEGGSIKTPQTEPAVSPSVTEVRVVLYNGTETVGLTKGAETTLLALSSLKVNVTEKDNAAKDDYKATIVIDLTGKDKATAERLAGVVKGKVASLPVGEEKPEKADVLIILGSDYK